MIRILNLHENLIESKMRPLTCVETKVVHLLNTYNLAIANKNVEYYRLLASSEHNFVDGMLLKVALSKRFRTNVYQYRGINLMKTILSNPQNGNSHLFICPDERNSLHLAIQIGRIYPQLKCEFIVPVFSNDLDRLRKDIYQKIGDTKFDYIWVGIGTPKQDFLAQQLSLFSHGSYILCIGAALEFLAGTKAEAPILFQNMGLEWLFRFIQEPRRLFKRYFIDSWGFIPLMARETIELVAK